MSHTPEPWRQGYYIRSKESSRMPESYITKANADEHCLLFSGFTEEDRGRSRILIARCERPEDAARIANCVSACAGMDDPEKEIEKLRADKQVMVDALEYYAATERERENDVDLQPSQSVFRRRTL